MPGGDSYLGKSTGRGGLALWMHNLKTRELIPSYSSSYYSGPAIRLGAGVQGWEAYQFADGLGHRVVGGTCPTVGVVGGYTQGGGHSTLSSLHGLAADNVLEWEVVTAAGEHVVATPVNDYSDLYWAMSGGGGGTYAVALSMTVRAHPDGPIGGGYLSFNDSSVGHEAFWDAIGAFQSFVPTVAKDGVSVLYSMYNHSFSMFSLTAPDRTVGQVSAFMAPVLAELDRRAVPYTFKPRSWPTFLQYFGTDMGPLPYGPYSSGQVTGSRLIPRSILSDPVRNAAVTKALRATVFTDDFFVACQALDVSNVTKLQVASNSVLPAWRDAASHCILVGSWDYDRPFADMRAKEESPHPCHLARPRGRHAGLRHVPERGQLPTDRLPEALLWRQLPEAARDQEEVRPRRCVLRPDRRRERRVRRGPKRAAVPGHHMMGRHDMIQPTRRTSSGILRSSLPAVTIE